MRSNAYCGNLLWHPSGSEELHNGYGDPANAERIAALKKLLTDLRTKYQDEDQFKDCHEYSL